MPFVEAPPAHPLTEPATNKHSLSVICCFMLAITTVQCYYALVNGHNTMSVVMRRLEESQSKKARCLPGCRTAGL